MPANPFGPSDKKDALPADAATETPPPRSFGAPPDGFAADIPILKKKEKERKGAGVPWYGGASAGAPGAELGSLVSTAEVGASLSGSPGFLGSARIAAALANYFGPGSLLGGLFASQFGPAVVLGGMLAWAAALGIAAVKLLGGGKAAETAGPFFAGPEPIGPSGISIATPKNHSLDFMSRAAKGELAWGDAPAAEKKPEPKKEPAPDPKPETPPTPQIQMPNVAAMMKKGGGLDPNGFIKKMSDGAGGGIGAGGGPKLANASGFELKKTFSPAGVGTRNQLTPLQKRTKRALGGNIGVQRAYSNEAMGQLKFAQRVSGTTYGSADTPAKQGATDAFEQGKTKGGDMLGVTDPGGDSVVPPSGLGDSASIPDVPVGNNVTPYQQQLDNANKAGQNAGTLKMIGLMLIIMGIGLIMTGIGLLNCTTFPIGLALIGAGMALMMVGFILLAVGASQANQAKNQGNDIGNQYGQQDQGNNINQCADARYAQANPTLCSSGQAPMDSNAGLAEHANPQICERLKAEMNACFSGGGVSCDSNYKAQGC